MKAFGVESGVVVPLDRANVDTDQIIPKQFLKSIRRTGFGDNLFDSWRFLDEGDIGVTPNERQINHDFVLNLPRYQDGGVLLARDNFGCGSSREHAVWALMEYGFKAVIAPSFADIFYNNCFKNGLLPIVLKEEKIDELFQLVAREPGFTLTIRLPDQRIELTDGTHVDFEIDAMRKRKLLEGLDDIDLTWAHTDAIRRFEVGYRTRRSWLFKD
ncbi:MAG: 3-isopropylmalate dehydratase small subunit [Gammaproteobacteria bacterium]|nr:3-isopropylmalate dehydratase small subunit [Gammaproteobacteria bacterium]